MADYINRSELLNKYNLDCRTAQERYLALVTAPAVDVAPVVHGRWEKASEKMPIYRCSICKERNLFKNGDNAFSRHCPNCGAKMDGKEE